MASVVIFDTEFTAWEGSRERKWTGPGEYREIVQIGAVRIDTATLDILDTLDILTKPVKNPQLSAYFTNLTGITQARLDKEGLSFAEGLQRFRDFVGASPAWCHGGDMRVMADNMVLQNIPVPQDWPTVEQSNIKPWFRSNAPETKGLSSGQLAAALGVPIDIAVHTGLGDSLSIVAAMRELVFGRGCKSPF